MDGEEYGKRNLENSTEKMKLMDVITTKVKDEKRIQDDTSDLILIQALGCDVQH